MLSSISSYSSATLNPQDRAAILKVLADMLPCEGMVVTEHAPLPNDLPRHKNFHLWAEIKPLHSNTVLVRLQPPISAKPMPEKPTCTSLFILAKSDDEWEMMGLPLPFNAQTI